MDLWFTGTAFAQDGTNSLFAGRLPMRRYNVPFCARLTKLFSARADLFVLPPTLSLRHWYEEVATMIRSTTAKHFGQHTETARAGWMTADAGLPLSTDNT